MGEISLEAGIKSELTALKNNIAASDSRIIALEAEKQALEKGNKQLMSQLANSAAEIKRRNKLETTLSNTIADMQKEQKENNERQRILKAQLAEREAQSAALREQIIDREFAAIVAPMLMSVTNNEIIAALKSQLATSNDETTKLKEALTLLKSKSDSFTSELLDRTNELETSRARISELEKFIEVRKKAYDENINVLQMQIEKQKKLQNQNNSRITELERLNRDLEASLKKGDSSFRAIRAKVAAFVKSKSDQDAAVTDRVLTLVNKLETEYGIESPAPLIDVSKVVNASKTLSEAETELVNATSTMSVLLDTIDRLEKAVSVSTEMKRVYADTIETRYEESADELKRGLALEKQKFVLENQQLRRQIQSKMEETETRLDKLTVERDALIRQRQSDENDLKYQQQRVSSLEDRVSELNNELHSNIMVPTFGEELEVVLGLGLYSKLESDLKEAEKELLAAKLNEKQLQQKADETLEAIATLQAQLQNANRVNLELRSEINSLIIVNDQITQKLNVALGSLTSDNINRAKEIQDSETRALTIELETKVKEALAAQSKLAELNIKYENSQRELQTALQGNVEIAEVVSKKDEEIRFLKERVDSLDNSAALVKAEIDAVKLLNANLTAEIETLNSRLEQSMIESRALESRLDSLLKANEEVQAVATQLASTNESLTAQVRSGSIDLGNLRNTVESLTNTISELEKQILQNNTAFEARLTSVTENSKRQISEITNEYESKIASLSKETLYEKDRLTKEYTAKVAEYDRERSTLETTLSDVRSTTSGKIRALYEKIAENELQIKSITDEKSKIEADFKKHEADIRSNANLDMAEAVGRVRTELDLQLNELRTRLDAREKSDIERIRNEVYAEARTFLEAARAEDASNLSDENARLEAIARNKIASAEAQFNAERNRIHTTFESELKREAAQIEASAQERIMQLKAEQDQAIELKQVEVERLKAEQDQAIKLKQVEVERLKDENALLTAAQTAMTAKFKEKETNFGSELTNLEKSKNAKRAQFEEKITALSRELDKLQAESKQTIAKVEFEKQDAINKLQSQLDAVNASLNRKIELSNNALAVAEKAREVAEASAANALADSEAAREAARIDLETAKAEFSELLIGANVKSEYAISTLNSKIKFLNIQLQESFTKLESERKRIATANEILKVNGDKEVKLRTDLEALIKQRDDQAKTIQEQNANILNLTAEKTRELTEGRSNLKSVLDALDKLDFPDKDKYLSRLRNLGGGGGGGGGGGDDGGDGGDGGGGSAVVTDAKVAEILTVILTSTIEKAAEERIIFEDVADAKKSMEEAEKKLKAAKTELATVEAEKDAILKTDAENLGSISKKVNVARKEYTRLQKFIAANQPLLKQEKLRLLPEKSYVGMQREPRKRSRESKEVDIGDEADDRMVVEKPADIVDDEVTADRRPVKKQKFEQKFVLTDEMLKSLIVKEARSSPPIEEAGMVTVSAGSSPGLRT
jgi:chromosome segregation ATPase